MLYGELGRYPLDITIKSRMISFWNKLLLNKNSKLSYLLYRKLFDTPNLEPKWLVKIKQILDDCGMSQTWLNQTPNLHLPRIVTQKLKDQFLQKWTNDLSNSTKGKNYSIFKESICLEPYFLKLLPKSYLSLVKFRTANHRFPSETLRWQGIDVNERKCNLCETNDVGDEMHYLLICPCFNTERSKYIKQYYYKRPNTIKLNQLLNTKNVRQLKQLSIFTDFLIKTVIS